MIRDDKILSDDKVKLIKFLAVLWHSIYHDEDIVVKILYLYSCAPSFQAVFHRKRMDPENFLELLEFIFCRICDINPNLFFASGMLRKLIKFDLFQFTICY